MINIKSLNITINEFKEKYWYGKNIEIPNFIKALNSDINEEQLFDKLASNIANTCDIFINQALSNGIGSLKQYDKIVDLIGVSKITNFKCAVYTELKYRLANQIFPEFQQKHHYLPQQFSISGGRDFNSIRELLSFEAIAFLRLNDWAQINNSICDANVDLLSKLNEANSELNKMINQNSANIENNTQMLIAYGHKVDEIDLNTKANAQKIIDVNSTLELKINTNKSALDNHIQNTNQMIGSVRIKNNEQDQELADLTVKVDSNQKGLMQVNDGLNTLQPSVNAIRHKTEQIDLALQANTQADSETLKKFNELNAKYAAEYAEVSTKISNAQNINNQQTTDIALLKNKTTSLEANVYQKTDIDNKFNDFSSKVIEINKSQANAEQAKMWLDLFVNNGGDGDNSYIDYDKEQINLMKAQGESETQLEPAKITLIENDDKAELTVSKIKGITNNTTKINNLEANVYTKQEIENKLEAITAIANISKENIDTLKLLTSRLKIYNDVVNSFTNPNLDNAAPGSSISANGKSCILMSKKITFIDTSYACRREGNCQPKRYSIILWEAD